MRKKWIAEDVATEGLGANLSGPPHTNSFIRCNEAFD
jgi:hypothetical protein